MPFEKIQDNFLEYCMAIHLDYPSQTLILLRLKMGG